MIKPRILEVNRTYWHGAIKEMTIVWTLFFFFALLSAGLHSCSDSSGPGKEIDAGFTIKNVSVPSSVNVAPEAEITVLGQGFANGDKIRLVLLSNSEKNHFINISTVNGDKAIFSLPKGVITGKYSVTVFRGAESFLLGSITLNIVTESSIPDINGMTIKGVVSSDDKGIEGVVVSDGYEVTTTNAEGIYYLASAKKNKYVFISVPGNYEVSNSNNLPVFFKRLSGGNSVEQKDFSLIKTNNSKHVVLAMADWHLANRVSDISQFTSSVLPDINATIAEYKSKGTKVYGLTLGDLSWDLYWYSNKFALPEYLQQMYKVNTTVFNVIGNHDNDPYASNDWDAALPFKEIVSPNYYSFNLGNIHYVVLDNINYTNTGGSNGTIGDRDYRGVVVPYQMDWLRKDLATIKDKSTPIVIAMHIPLYNRPALVGNGNQTNTPRLDNASEIVTVLSEFSNVSVLTGHSHNNYTAEPSSSLMEHNIGAICATWWWTGYHVKNHICTDGSPGGYGVWEMDGKDMKWYYKSIGYAKEYQFRTTDLNSVHITAEKYAPASNNTEIAKYAGPYATPNNNNEVLINVWGYDTQWKIEVKENGNSLGVERVNAMDPLHIISYDAQRLNAKSTVSFPATNTNHLFKVKASNSANTLEIKVTDRFGRIYTESMKRPKEFDYSMK